MIVEKKCSRMRILHWTKGGNVDMQKVEKDHVLCGVTQGNALFPPNTLSGPSVRYSLSILFFLFKKKKLWTSEQSFIITKMTRSNGRLEPEVIVNVRLKYNEKKKKV